MKTRNLVLSSAVCLLFFSSSFTSQKASKFNSSDITLGMDKTEFIKNYGEPFNKDASLTNDGKSEETLFYKEELYNGTWYIVTTAFTFVDGKLTKQKVEKEERVFKENDSRK